MKERSERDRAMADLERWAPRDPRDVPRGTADGWLVGLALVLMILMVLLVGLLLGCGGLSSECRAWLAERETFHVERAP